MLRYRSRFSLKDFRSTFARTAKDRGVSLEAGSQALRHRNTRTTETYYARMRPDEAFRQLRQAFLLPVGVKEADFAEVVGTPP